MFQLHFKTAYRESGTQDPGLVIRDPGPSTWDRSRETQNPGTKARSYTRDLRPSTWDPSSGTWDYRGYYEIG